MMDKQKQLVRALLSQTKHGGIEWKEGIRSETYQVSFKDNSVAIREYEDKQGNVYEISLLNAEGKAVDAFTDGELDQADPDFGAPSFPWYDRMRELYDLARRTALGSEKVLNDILKELGDEEIPF